MEYQKIIFWIEINDQSRGVYNSNSELDLKLQC